MSRRARCAWRGAALLAALAALAPAAEGAPRVCLSESEAFCCAPKNPEPHVNRYRMTDAMGCSSTWDASSCPGWLVEYVPATASSVAIAASSAACKCGRQGDPHAVHAPWTFDCTLLECTTGKPPKAADSEGICIALGLVEEKAALILGLTMTILVAIVVAVVVVLALLVWCCCCRRKRNKTTPAPEKGGLPVVDPSAAVKMAQNA